MVLLSNVTINFECDFESIHISSARWTDEIEPPFLLLDKGFDIKTDLFEIYKMEFDCISLWNPFGYESMASDFSIWNQVDLFPRTGAMLVKDSNYDFCIYPEVSRVAYESNIISIEQMKHFQNIGKSVSVKLPYDSTQYAFTSKTGSAIIRNSLPGDILMVDKLPSGAINQMLKFVSLEIYANIGIVCHGCATVYMLRQFIKLLGIPMFSFKSSIPSRQDFLENYFSMGYLSVPYGLMTLYIVPEPVVTANIELQTIDYKYEIIQPKTSCADYCVFKEKRCDIHGLMLINTCDAMQTIFDCKYCYSGRRLIFYFKTGICEVANLDKLSCHSTGYGNTPCICTK